MYSFAFVDASTGQTAPLDLVEAKFLDWYGDHGGLEFELLTMVGDYCTFHGPFEQCKFDKAADTINLSDEEKNIFLYFLNGGYEYCSWR